MNRRDLVRATALTAALAVTPAVAQAAVTKPFVKASPEALAHEHAKIALDWIERVVRDGFVTGRDVWPIDLRIELKSPRFEMDLGKAWDSSFGYRTERTGPRVKVFDNDVLVIEGETFFYTGRSFADEIPPVSMISRHVEDANTLRNLLPGQVHYDNSQFIAAMSAQKARAA